LKHLLLSQNKNRTDSFPDCTADTALRLAAFFGTSSGFWLGLQADYDTEEAAKELSGALAQIQRFEPLAA